MTSPPPSFWITKNKRKNNQTNKLLWLCPLHHPLCDACAVFSFTPSDEEPNDHVCCITERTTPLLWSPFFMITLRRAPRPVQRRESVRYTLLYGRRQDSYSGCAVWETVLYAMARWGLGKSAPLQYFSLGLTLRPPVGDHSKVLIMGLNGTGRPQIICVSSMLEEECLYTQFPKYKKQFI